MKTARIPAAIVLTAGICAFAFGEEPADKVRMNRDQLRIAVQEICPVSGEKLGEHGSPVKVRVGKEEVFLCCEACLKGKVKPEHWATIHGNFAAAQRICPVMKHKLPENPKWTIVEGQIIFVCCPPCTKKIAADPQVYLQKVADLYQASLQASKAHR